MSFYYDSLLRYIEMEKYLSSATEQSLDLEEKEDIFNVEEILRNVCDDNLKETLVKIRLII
jgi:predicted nucleotidyltransferase